MQKAKKKKAKHYYYTYFSSKEIKTQPKSLA